MILVVVFYPFGMLQPGRKFSAGSGYRYGFNGKENDNEVKGEGNQQDYGMRIYDGRLGRFLTEDPLATEYPELTPYQFASLNPITLIDRDGLEGESYLIPSLAPILKNPVAREIIAKGKTFFRELFRTPQGPAKPIPIILPFKLPVADPTPGPNDGYKQEPNNKPRPGFMPKDDGSFQTQPHTEVKPTPNPKRPGVKLGENDDDDTYLFRGGSYTDLNFTPRPGKDDGTDSKSGLSTFLNPISATRGEGGKVQILSSKKLVKLGFVVTIDGSHVGIRPKSQRALEIWAASRLALEQGKPAHLLTKTLKKARVSEQLVPKTKR